jgi:hypothetical protein
MLGFEEFKQTVLESLSSDIEYELIEESEKGEYDTVGWRTTKTPEGHKWEVHGFKYGKGETVIHSGIEDTRARAVGKAKKHVVPARRANETK